MFEAGDRVRLMPAVAGGGLNGLLGTVLGFVTPPHGASLDVLDDVVVRWDLGLEYAHAPFTLEHAEPKI